MKLKILFLQEVNMNLVAKASGAYKALKILKGHLEVSFH